MTAISWAGYNPQSIIITALMVLVIFGFGLYWESLMALIASVSSTSITLLVKGLIQRPRSPAALVHVIETLHSYSFPSGHVMFYTWGKRRFFVHQPVAEGGPQRV